MASDAYKERAGEALRLARIASGLTQAEVQEQTGIAQPTLSDYERGRHFPGTSNMSALMSAYGTTPDAILQAAGPGPAADRIGELEAQVVALTNRLATIEAAIANRPPEGQ